MEVPSHSPQAPAPACRLSVVVAGVDSPGSAARALAALARACRDQDAEILFLDGTGAVEPPTGLASAVRVHRVPAGTSTPVMWAAGFARSRGRIVAFTTADFMVTESWARSLIRAIDAGATGAAGALTLSEGTSVVGWATFFLRYSAFLTPSAEGDASTLELPGDNAAYRREALLRHAHSFVEGFWEVDFHRRLRAEPGHHTLALVAGAEARFVPAVSLATVARQRFAHGSHSGAWRVETGARATWQVVLSAPLVPLVLTARMARRVGRARGYAWRFIASLPALLSLAAAWAAGEAWGALRGRSVMHAAQPRVAV